MPVVVKSWSMKVLKCHFSKGLVFNYGQRSLPNSRGGGASEVIKRGLVVENISAILNSCFFMGGWGGGGGASHFKIGCGKFWSNHCPIL